MIVPDVIGASLHTEFSHQHFFNQFCNRGRDAPRLVPTPKISHLKSVSERRHIEGGASRSTYRLFTICMRASEDDGVQCLRSGLAHTVGFPHHRLARLPEASSGARANFVREAYP